MTQTYIPIAFGQDADDLIDIPFETVDDGSVSYQQGFGPRYQLKLRVNPSALPFPRGQFNQLMLTITQNQQSWMKYGLPLWTDEDQNLGEPLAYPINAEVYHLGETYQNLVADNVAEPGTDSTWLITSGAQDGVQVGMIMGWSTIGSPTGRYFFLDGSAVSRTTYSDLFNKLCPLNNGDTTNLSDVITNLDVSALEYGIGMKVEGAGIPVGATVEEVLSATSVRISANATATAANVNIRFFVWGNGDGSTTFNIPDGDGMYFACSGATGIEWSGQTFTKVADSFGGSVYQLTTNNLPAHTHVTPGGAGYITGGDTGIAYGSTGNQFGQHANTGGITGGTTETPIPQIPPSKMLKFFIRY